MINYLAFITSISLASIAAFFSIVGLSTIFPGAYWSVIIMAGSLEVGKLVTAAWLHLEWKKISIPIKTYLTSAVIVLMFITSMGIFGYLSKAHLEQETKSSNNDVKLENLQRKISSETRKITAIDAQLDSLDAALEEYISRGFVTRGLNARDDQKEERSRLESTREEISDSLEVLQENALELEKEKIAFELEIGAIKYIAELVYGEQASSYYDKAVRAVILSLVFVFDPLAVVLLIASTKGIVTKKEETPSAVATKEILIIDDPTIKQKQESSKNLNQTNAPGSKKSRPKWLKKGAYASILGWRSKNGELLKRQKMTQEQVNKLNNVGSDNEPI